MKTMMPKMMAEMFGKMDPAQMRSMMEGMPAMMEQCFGTMDAEETGSMMHDARYDAQDDGQLLCQDG
jgi:hypothetical protein